MDLTPTSYAILGLLVRRPWSAYELAIHWQRSELSLILPKARSNIYREPKRLESGGYVTSTTEPSPHLFGRTRTRYEITDQGAAALEAWLGSDLRTDPITVSEVLLRVFLADPAEAESTLAVINRVRDRITAQLAHIRSGPAGESANTAMSIEVTRLQRRLLELVDLAMLQWCEEATAVVGTGGGTSSGT